MNRDGIKFRIKRYLNQNHKINADYLNSLSLSDLIKEYLNHKEVEKSKQRYFDNYKNKIVAIQYKYNYKKFDENEITKTMKLNTPYPLVNIAINNVIKSHILINELPLCEDGNNNEFIETQRIFNKFYIDVILDDDKYW
jgi:hypothetical protein